MPVAKRVRRAKQFYDDLAHERSEENWKKEEGLFRKATRCNALRRFVQKHFSKPCRLGSELNQGSYNMVYTMHLHDPEDGKATQDVILRIPCSGIVKFPDEKTIAEAATMRVVGENTSIPVPFVYSYELSEANPAELGAFIIMSFIKHNSTVSGALDDPKRKSERGHPILNPDVSEATLTRVYDQMAGYLLQLFRLEFPKIGSLAPNPEGKGGYSVEGRPLPANLNCLLDLANVPASVLPPPGTTYKTSDSWYCALAEMHMTQLIFQRNHLVYTKSDCWNKYVARLLFLRLAREGKLSTFGFVEDTWSAQSAHRKSQCPAPARDGSFRIWCDDLRGGNILVGEDMQVAGVVDWEFAYVGPTQFSLDPPWWLLLEEPECWPEGIDDWAHEYDSRLKTWLQSMERAEQERDMERLAQQTGQLGLHDTPANDQADAPPKLSEYMRESWEMGRFWLNYAARKSWAFDTIYWLFLDELFFGDRGDVPEYLWAESRLNLLSEEELRAMFRLTFFKMEDLKEEERLENWDPEGAEKFMARFMV